VLGDPALNIVNARQLAGGRSKQTVLARQQGSDHLPEVFVMRQDWAAGGVQGTTVVTEFELLKILAGAGLKVPVPLLLESSTTPLGPPFMIVTCMSGTSQGGYFDPPRSAPLALQLAEQLARLHQIPVDAFSTASLRREPETQQQRLEGIENYKRTYMQLSEPVTAIDMAIRWLVANSDQVRGKFSLIHNDIGAHNLLIDGEELVAVLDWELASIGNPAADLGYARSWLEQIVPWDSFIRSYRAAGGPEIDDATLDFYTLLSRLRLYTMLLQARAGIASGVIHDLEITNICADSLPRLLRCICTDLARILAVE
jgi:aminoglycoside phosphotransferase (APT) family kinase protein